MNSHRGIGGRAFGAQVRSLARAWTGSMFGVSEEQQRLQHGWREAREGQAGSGRTAVHVVHCTTQEGTTHMHHGAPCRTSLLKSSPGPGVGDKVREVPGSPMGQEKAFPLSETGSSRQESSEPEA